jgi:hypothetical protein
MVNNQQQERFQQKEGNSERKNARTYQKELLWSLVNAIHRLSMRTMGNQTFHLSITDNNFVGWYMSFNLQLKLNQNQRIIKTM